MHWHYATLELVPADQLVRPMISPETDVDEAGARAAIAGLLERLGLVEAGRVWAAGAKDDVVYHDRLIFTVFPCDRPTCAETFAAFGEEWAGVLGSAGLDVQVAKPPQAG